MKINFHAFIDNLQYMGLGMLGIFVVILVLVGVVCVLNRITKNKMGEQ